ncbi:MAG: hypothetical protein EBV03_04465 [Proteobacteria bacterium]|nr:hypothetical protein [Pseudomonadota bacterium]
MRITALFTAALALLGAHAANAQTAAQTLDAQMQRMAPRQQPATAQHPAPPAQGAPQGWPALQGGVQTPGNAITNATPQQPQQPIRATNASVPWNAPAPTAAQPAQPGWDSLGSGAIPALPLEVFQTQGGIRYINGGVGDEEMAQLKAQGAEYNVQVMLSAPKGEFISDVTLRLLDAAGNPLIMVQDAGPYFYAKVPPGDYVLDTATPGEHHVVYNQQ